MIITGKDSRNMRNITEIAGGIRIIAGADEFLDFVAGLQEGRFVTFGYVKAVSLNYPQKKEKNPLTNRMHSVDDYATFGKEIGEEGDITGVIKISTYNMQWQSTKKTDKAYSDFKNKRDEIKQKYGLPIISRSYTSGSNYGDKTRIYNGDNEALKGNSYSSFNFHGIKPLSEIFYLTFSDGSIREISKDKLLKYFKPKQLSTAESLINKGVPASEVDCLRNMSYIHLIHGQILFISGTSDGVRSLYINTKLPSKINQITGIDEQKLIDIAYNLYSKNLNYLNKGLQESKTGKANRIQISESIIRNLVYEVVARILNENQPLELDKSQLRKLQSLKNKIAKFNQRLQAYFEMVEDETLPDIDSTIVGSYSPMELINVKDIENGFVAIIDGEPVTVQYVMDEGEMWLIGDDELEDYLKYENRRINKGIRIWKSENPDYEEERDDVED